jgi:DNA-binding IclR family transcriptional regulator
MRNDEAASIKSVDNALQIVELLGATESLRVVDVAAHLGVARSTAHRILSALMARGFVIQDGQKVYRTGPAFERLRQGRSTARDLRDVVHPHLEALARSTGETVHVGVLEGSGTRFIDGVESRQVLRVGTRVGMLLPADRTAIGRVLLATLPPATIRALYPRGVTGDARDAKASLLALERQINRVRRMGYARNDGESDAGISAVAMCLKDHSGRPVAGVAIALPRPRFDRKQVPYLVDKLKTMTARAQAEL